MFRCVSAFISYFVLLQLKSYWLYLLALFVHYVNRGSVIKNNSLLCISCSESFHKKCLKPTHKTCNKFHVSKSFLCVGSAFKNLPFYQSSDSSDYFSTGPKSDFPSNDKLKLVNNCNSLEIISNNEEDIFKIKSKYFTIKEFLNLHLNDNTLRPILDALLKQGVLRLFQQGLVRLGTTLL